MSELRANALSDLTQALELVEIPPEDPRAERVVRPLEQLASTAAAPPAIEGIGGDMARALWYKHNPQNVDAQFLVGLSHHNLPLVRLVAVEALAVACQQRTVPPETLPPHALREIIKSGSLAESSPLVQVQWRRLETLFRRGRDDERRAALKKRQVEVRTSPFSLGTPVRGVHLLFGREGLVAELGRLIAHHGYRTIVLRGARRMGKTSILYGIEDGALGAGFTGVYFDLQSVAGAPLSSFLRAVIDRVAQRLAALPSVDPPAVPSGELSAGQAIDYLAAAAGSLPHGERLILLVDEYEGMERYLGNPEFAGRLEHLIEGGTGPCFIFAGTKKLEGLRQSSLARVASGAKYVKVSYLDKDATLRLTTSLFGEGRVSTDAAEQLYMLTGGHPFYTQTLCQHVFDIATVAPSITAAHVEQAVTAFLDAPPPHLVGTWNNLTDEEELVATVLAQQGPAGGAFYSTQDVMNWFDRKEFPASLAEGEVAGLLADMTDVDLIDRDVERAAFRFRPDIVRRWILANRNLDEMAHLHRERVLNRVGSIWRQLLAATIDLAAIIVTLLITVSFARNAQNEWIVPVVFVIAGAAGVIVPMAVSRSTLGMRLVLMEAVGWNARPLPRWRAAVYATLLIVRLLIVLFFVVALTEGERVAAGVMLTLMLVDGAFWIWSDRHRGLMERLARALLLVRD